jgi:FKBP12-rapamycin complex-associated protein
MGWYQRLYDQIMSSLKPGNIPHEVIHGSLIALGELLRQSGTFMMDKYKTVADIILKYWNLNNRLIKQTVISLLPVLARYNKSAFTQTYLPTIMSQLLAALKRDNERAHAFIAVGKIALAITDHIKEYLDPIIAVVKSSLATVRSRAQICNEALTCLSMLATAVGPALQPYVKELLTPMFSVGLTPTLVKALTSLITHVPDLAFDIQIRLLDLLSQVLAQRPFICLGIGYTSRNRGGSGGGGGGGSGLLLSGSRPHSQSSSSATSTSLVSAAATAAIATSTSSSLLMGSGSSFSTSGNLLSSVASSSVVESQTQDPALITLALKTLGSFDFHKYLLVEFLRDTVVHFLEHDNAMIRKEAVITCCKLMTPRSGRSPFSLSLSLSSHLFFYPSLHI